MKRTLCTYVLLILFAQGGAQSNLDSLLRLVKTAPNDTNKIKTYIAIASEYSFRNPDSSILFATRAIELAKKLNKPFYAARANYEIAWSWYSKGNYPVAQEIAFDLLKYAEKTKNDMLIMSGHNLLATIYSEMDEQEKALHYHQKVLELAQRTGYGDGVAASFGNIAIVYDNMGRYHESLIYCFKAIDKYTALHNPRGVAAQYSNIAVSYMNQGDSAVAKGNRKFAMENKYAHAAKFALEGISRSKAVQNERGILTNTLHLAEIYLRMEKWDECKALSKETLRLAQNFNSLSAVFDSHMLLYTLYKKEGRYEQALAHYKAYIVARDSIENDENIRKQELLEMQYEFDKKQTADSIQVTEKRKRAKLLHDQQVASQKMYTLGGIIAFSLMLVVAVVSFRAFRQKKKDNRLIMHQKILVEEKQRELVDSIYYAQRIQRALLPSEKYITRTLTKK
ncbi:MAG TPA: tetratricopeptide repeat protein [Flavobacteriales bacterium]|nr:tetratricopeptide repeat protein [Flavobacteriales bacterium]